MATKKKTTKKKTTKKKTPKKTAAKRTPRGDDTWLDVEVDLLDAEPRVWRRFLLHGDASFAELHAAIQDACGWEHAHLYAFRDGEKTIAGSPDDMGFGPPTPDARKRRVRAFLGERSEATLLYEYDFGDGWEHRVVIRQTTAPEGVKKRKLEGGARAFPPEDCGGIPGYERFVELRKTGRDPWGEDPEDLEEWLGDWDPEAFDLDEERAYFDR